MTTTINADTSAGLISTADTSGILKVQSNGKTTNALAWVNFNGTGTVAIRSSYNVSSITDNGTGDYTINFTNAMADTNYSMAGSARYNSSSDATAIRYVGISSATTLASVMQTTSLRVVTGFANGSTQDPDVCCVNIFGN